MRLNFKVLTPLGIILIFSLTTIWSAVPNLFLSQAGLILNGLVLLFLISRLDLSLIKPFNLFLYVFGLILLILTLTLGHSIRSTTRWLYLGPISLQTSELVKPLFILFWADFVDRNPLNKIINIFKYSILVIIPVILVFIQPDLGSSIIIAALGFSIALLAGLPLRYLGLALVVSTAILFLSFPHLRPYQKERLYTFINPYTDPQGQGYNTIQSIIAIGSGKLFGRGVRQGIQSQLKFLPERHADFAFASFAEEFGLIGSTALIIAYSFLFFQFFKIALNQKNNFFYYIASSILFIFCLQVLINISVNLGLLPVTGIPLPLFSYGGSSVVSHLILIGFILSLARNNLKV